MGVALCVALRHLYMTISIPDQMLERERVFVLACCCLHTVQEMKSEH